MVYYSVFIHMVYYSVYTRIKTMYTHNTGWSRKNQTETLFNYKQDIFIKQ